MTADRDMTPIIRAWLHEVTSLPEGGLRAVLEQLPATPQERPGWTVRRPRRESPSGHRGATRRPQAMPAVAAIAALFATGAIVAGSLYFATSPPRPAALPSPSASAERSAPLSGAIKLAPGQQHSCALLSDGRVRCWGENAWGQLGDGTTTDSGIPVEVVGIRGATDVASGAIHTCAIVGGGRVYCWGGNWAGQLGDGTRTDDSDSVPGSPTPVEVVGLGGATAIAAGGGHTCALVDDGRARCWGENYYGQLGDGTTTARLVPVEVAGLEGAIALAAGDDHTCANLVGGKVACWGWDGSRYHFKNDETKGSPIPVVVAGVEGSTAIGAGGHHSCAVVAAGSLRCWGDNTSGQLGDGTNNGSALAIEGGGGITGATEVTGGQSHTCALVAGGTVSCWGENDAGQLGDGTTVASPDPVQVADLVGATSIDAGDYHTCAIVARGEVRCWGESDEGQLGDGQIAASASPVAVSHVLGAVALGGGPSHTCAILANGHVRCWGLNGSGQLGDGTLTNRAQPVDVADLDGATAVAGGWGHTCVLGPGGGVRCWGANEFGQLGDGTTVPRGGPVDVIGVEDATALAADDELTCALLHTGRVRCWGANAYGQLGDGTTKDRALPVEVRGIEDATAIDVGGGHACALRAGGAVWCWGWGGYGQLGSANVGGYDSSVPIRIEGIEDAVGLAADGTHACAIVQGGQVRCWGEVHMTDGDGVPTVRSDPYEIEGIEGATAVAAGWWHNCVLLAGGRVRCWGSNAGGELGDGSAVDPSVTPVEVVGLEAATALVVGGGHGCAIVDDGQVRCWGWNGSGQLGDGSRLWTPVTVGVGEP